MFHTAVLISNVMASSLVAGDPTISIGLHPAPSAHAGDSCPVHGARGWTMPLARDLPHTAHRFLGPSAKVAEANQSRDRHVAGNDQIQFTTPALERRFDARQRSHSRTQIGQTLHPEMPVSLWFANKRDCTGSSSHLCRYFVVSARPDCSGNSALSRPMRELCPPTSTNPAACMKKW